MSPTDALNLAVPGFEALRRGDLRQARDAFLHAAAKAPADAGVLAGLAQAQLGLGDLGAAAAAVERALAADPRHLRALVLKADLLAANRDERTAASFYRIATQVAPPAEQLPPDLREALQRAGAMVEHYAGKFESFLLDRLRTAGEGPPSERFSQSLDIMLGRKSIYVQQPQKYYFPELPQIQFYARETFPWMDEVEAATDAIRSELVSVMSDPGVFTPYVERDTRHPRAAPSSMTDNPDWSAFYLWKRGRPVPENIARCPRTAAAMSKVPFSQIENRSPEVLFSLLRPGTRIPPHTGLVNTRLICHLPLIVPQGCGFRVGNDIRTPVEGRCWAFDDSMEHEAWNEGTQSRVILLFEIWRPELTASERDLVRTMFEAIDAYDGPAAV